MAEKLETTGCRIVPWSDDLKVLRDGFICGVDDLDSYFKRQASQDIAKRACAFFAALDCDSERIAGFYTLAMYSVSLPDIPAELKSKLPRYPLVPAVLFGRLAVDLKFRGKGIGEMLLLDAMNKALDNEIAWWAMIVHSKEESRSFYLRYGFCSFKDDKNRLFLPYKTIWEAFKSKRDKVPERSEGCKVPERSEGCKVPERSDEVPRWITSGG